MERPDPSTESEIPTELWPECGCDCGEGGGGGGELLPDAAEEAAAATAVER